MIETIITIIILHVLLFGVSVLVGMELMKEGF